MSFSAALWVSLRREILALRSSGWDLVLLLVLPLVALVAVCALFAGGVPRDIPVALVDSDHSGLSRLIERDLRAAPKLRLAATPAALADAWTLMRKREVYAVVYIPPGFERDTLRHRDGVLSIWLNAAFQTVAAQAADAAEKAAGAAIATTAPPARVATSAPPLRLRLPQVQVNIIGNPEGSFELFLEALAMPLILNLLLSSAAVYAVGRELADRTLASWSVVCGGRTLAALIGKLAPYVGVYWLWCVAWTAFLAGWRGWAVAGSLPLLLAGELLFFLATTALAAALPALLRQLDLALSLSTLYAGSALSFANATLTLNGSPWYTRAWSAVLPSTAYVQLQQQQWVLGSPLATAWGPVAVLALFIAVPLSLAVWGLNRLIVAPPPTRPLMVEAPAADFLGSLAQTLRGVVQVQPVFATIIASVVLYGFYYPSAYKVQTVVKLPVAVVDLDRSPLSRTFLRDLDATREVQVVAQLASLEEGRRWLAADKIDGLVLISGDLERGVLRGTPSGISADLKGAYLVRARYLGQALSAAIGGAVQSVMSPLAASAHSVVPRSATLQRPLYNTDNGYGDYTVPGVASIILQATLLFGVAMFIGLRREGLTWRMTPAAFFGTWAAFTGLGSLMSFFFFGFVLWFQDYPRGGDLVGLLFAVPLYAATVSALGMVLGAGFARHERSMQILAGTSIALFFLSGLSWPAFAMPPMVQALARLIPSTTGVPMFVQLNSMGAAVGEVMPALLTLLSLLMLYGAGAYLRLTSASLAIGTRGRA